MELAIRKAASIFEDLFGPRISHEGMNPRINRQRLRLIKEAFQIMRSVTDMSSSKQDASQRETTFLDIYLLPRATELNPRIAQQLKLRWTEQFGMDGGHMGAIVGLSLLRPKSNRCLDHPVMFWKYLLAVLRLKPQAAWAQKPWSDMVLRYTESIAEWLDVFRYLVLYLLPIDAYEMCRIGVPLIFAQLEIIVGKLRRESPVLPYLREQASSLISNLSAMFRDYCKYCDKLAIVMSKAVNGVDAEIMAKHILDDGLRIIVSLVRQNPTLLEEADLVSLLNGALKFLGDSMSSSMSTAVLRMRTSGLVDLFIDSFQDAANEWLFSHCYAHSDDDKGRSVPSLTFLCVYMECARLIADDLYLAGLFRSLCSIFAMLNTLYTQQDAGSRFLRKVLQDAAQLGYNEEAINRPSSVIFILQCWKLLSKVTSTLTNYSNCKPTKLKEDRLPFHSENLALEEMCSLMNAGVTVDIPTCSIDMANVLLDLLNAPHTILVWHWRDFMIWYDTAGGIEPLENSLIGYQGLVATMQPLFVDILENHAEKFKYYICPYKPQPGAMPKVDQSWPMLRAESHPCYKLIYFVSIMTFLQHFAKSPLAKVFETAKHLTGWISDLPAIMKWAASLKYAELNGNDFEQFISVACSFLSTFDEESDIIISLKEQVMAAYVSYWRRNISRCSKLDPPTLLLSMYYEIAIIHKMRSYKFFMPSPYLDFGRMILDMSQAKMEASIRHMENENAYDANFCLDILSLFMRALSMCKAAGALYPQILGGAEHCKMFWEKGLKTYWTLREVCSAGQAAHPKDMKSWDEQVAEYMFGYKDVKLLDDSELQKAHEILTACHTKIGQFAEIELTNYSSPNPIWRPAFLDRMNSDLKRECYMSEGFVAVRKEMARREKMKKTKEASERAQKMASEQAKQRRAEDHQERATKQAIAKSSESAGKQAEISKLDAVAQAEEEAAKKAKKSEKRARQKAAKAKAADEESEKVKGVAGPNPKLKLNAIDKRGEENSRSTLNSQGASQPASGAVDTSTPVAAKVVQAEKDYDATAKQPNGKALGRKSTQPSGVTPNRENIEIQRFGSQKLTPSERGIRQGTGAEAMQSGEHDPHQEGLNHDTQADHAAQSDVEEAFNLDKSSDGDNEISLDDPFWQHAAHSAGSKTKKQEKKEKKPGKARTSNLQPAARQMQQAQTPASLDSGSGLKPSKIQPVPSRPLPPPAAQVPQPPRPAAVQLSPEQRPAVADRKAQLMADEEVLMERVRQKRVERHRQGTDGSASSVDFTDTTQLQDNPSQPGNQQARPIDISARAPIPLSQSTQAGVSAPRGSQPVRGRGKMGRNAQPHFRPHPSQQAHIQGIDAGLPAAQMRPGFLGGFRPHLGGQAPRGLALQGFPHLQPFPPPMLQHHQPFPRPMQHQARPRMPHPVRPRGTSTQGQQQSMEEFCTCPITQDIMQDPVLAKDGFTYERAAISAWLSNHDTSPMTNAILPSKELHPNLVVKQMVGALPGRL